MEMKLISLMMAMMVASASSQCIYFFETEIAMTDGPTPCPDKACWARAMHVSIRCSYMQYCNYEFITAVTCNIRAKPLIQTHFSNIDLLFFTRLSYPRLLPSEYQ